MLRQAKLVDAKDGDKVYQCIDTYIYKGHMLVCGMDGKPNYQSAMRIEKLDTIELVIGRCSNEGLPATKHELFVFCAERWGCEWRKFIEYLSDLVMRKMIVIDGNELWSMRRWQKIKIARDKDHLKMKDLIYAN